jgi:four helix bundle protein
MQTKIQSFQDLQVYQLAFKCSVDVYEQLQPFPEAADIHVARKLLATSRGVRAHIATAWGQRRNYAALLNQLSAAQLAAAETQAWIEAAIAAGFLSADVGQDLYDRYRYLYGALDHLMENAALGSRLWSDNNDETLPATA